MAPHKLGTPPDTGTMYSPPSAASFRRPLRPGIYAPTPCFFDASEDVDTTTIGLHAVRLADAGLAGLTVQGSNGEAVHLSPSERNLVTHTTRNALDEAGYSTLPIIAGCGAQSTRETVQLCRDAADAGADYALALPPSYFAASYSRAAIRQHFVDVADASPIPLLVYNYPAAAGGLDLDSDFLTDLSEHPNVVGAKLTCGNVGKLARLVAATAPEASSESASDKPLVLASAAQPLPYIVLAGSADFLLPALACGGAGALAGLANIAPKTHVAMQRAHARGQTAEALRLQRILARADAAAQRGGVVGAKAALAAHFGYGGQARRPLPRVGKEELRRAREDFDELVRLEKSL